MTPSSLSPSPPRPALLAGWRLYLVTLITGLGMKFGWVALPDQLQALDVLANNWVPAIAGIGTLCRILRRQDRLGRQRLGCRPQLHSPARRCASSASPSSIVPIQPGRSAASCSAAERRWSPMPARPGRVRWSTPARALLQRGRVDRRGVAAGGLLALAIANPIAAAIIALGWSHCRSGWCSPPAGPCAS